MHAQYWGDHSNCQKTIDLLNLWLPFLQCYIIGYIRTLKGIPEMQFVLSNSE